MISVNSGQQEMINLCLIFPEIAIEMCNDCGRSNNYNLTPFRSTMSQL
jgi:hypothetical protein